MSTKRLRKRISSARFEKVAKLSDMNIKFNKKGKDGSGKANLVNEQESVVWGVIFEFPDQDIDRLDLIEGGYDRVTVNVDDHNNEDLPVETYISDNLTQDERPTLKYKNYVIGGAKEHKLPDSYIKYLEGFPSKPDIR